MKTTYPDNWHSISQDYRRKMHYTCERCGITLSAGVVSYYLDVHHLDGNKQNNDPSNLQCLCVDCHSQVNEAHQRVFSRGDEAQRLREFRSAVTDMEDLEMMGYRNA